MSLGIMASIVYHSGIVKFNLIYITGGDNMTKQDLIDTYGTVWTTDELTSEFSIDSFMAPFCFGTHKESGRKYSIQFQHSPRFYFNAKVSN